MNDQKTQHIPMCACESSQVKGYGYDEGSKTLAVEFKGGGIYHYHDVPADTFAAMKEATSIGKFLGSSIKGTYQFSKIGKMEE